MAFVISLGVTCLELKVVYMMLGGWACYGYMGVSHDEV